MIKPTGEWESKAVEPELSAEYHVPVDLFVDYVRNGALMTSKFVATLGAASVLTAGLGATATAEEAETLPVNPTCVEQHTFSGASSAIPDFKAWFAGEEFVENPAQTRDLSEFSLPNGETVRGGDIICKSIDGQFTKLK